MTSDVLLFLQLAKRIRLSSNPGAAFSFWVVGKLTIVMSAAPLTYEPRRLSRFDHPVNAYGSTCLALDRDLQS